MLARAAAGLAVSGGLLAVAALPANAAGVVNSAAALATADDYIGTPYRFGGTTPAGFDCSGYTQHVYTDNGIALPRTTGEQPAATTRISKSEARPGDLVFFVNASGRPYHVGIYTGEGPLMTLRARVRASVSAPCGLTRSCTHACDGSGLPRPGCAFGR